MSINFPWSKPNPTTPRKTEKIFGLGELFLKDKMQ